MPDSFSLTSLKPPAPPPATPPPQQKIPDALPHASSDRVLANGRLRVVVDTREVGSETSVLRLLTYLVLLPGYGLTESHPGSRAG